MTREQAIEIARAAARAKPQSYYAEPFEPHEWVIDAIMAVGAALRDDLDGARAELRREQDARAQLRVELDRTKAERDEAQMLCRDARIQAMDRGASYQASQAELAKLQLAAPVMLSVMALLADEADVKGLREVALWFYDMDPEHLNTWLDAERARTAREPCCPSSTLPGSTHDVGCRGGGKVH